MALTGSVAAGATFVVGNQGDLIINDGVSLPNSVTISGGTNSYLSFENTTAGTFAGPIALNANVIVEAADWYQPAVGNAQAGTISGVVSGVGSMTISANGGTAADVVTLSNTNTFSGGLNIQGASATLSAVGAAGTGNIVLSTSTLSGLTETVANALTGSQSLTVSSGTATLSQANNYTGGTTVNGGTLTITAANSLGTGALIVSGGTLNANVAGAISPVQQNLNQTGGTVNQSVANAFQGPISLNLSGGTTNLSFANSYTGGATISGTNVTNVSARRCGSAASLPSPRAARCPPIWRLALPRAATSSTAAAW